jgi:hypothetical protein
MDQPWGVLFKWMFLNISFDAMMTGLLFQLDFVKKKLNYS